MQHVTRADGTRVIGKSRADMPDDFFVAEACGLQWLRDAGGLRVPVVYEVRDDGIVLEDLGLGRRGPDYWHQVAEGLASQHGCVGHAHGLDRRGFCGDSVQDNTPDGDGWRFFAERRLLPQMRRARDGGRIDKRDADVLERLCGHLHEIIPDMPPVLLHGDLWSGNLHVCADGAPALIDAGAVHYGWAEAELAMMTLFGSPPAGFFARYREQADLRRDWRERVPVYNLYHLLNHLNLFGGGYLGSVRNALARCA